jgi:fumarylacetoacetate (FAA) hydrolase
MKLATLKTKSRDGQLLVVSKDLTKAIEIPHVAPTLQQLLDHWQELHPRVDEIYQNLNEERGDWFAFDPTKMAAPLPRAYQWADGSAYLNHVELVRKARGALMPEKFWHDPLMYQGGSDSFLGPCEDIPVHDTEWGVDFEAEIGAILDDVPMGMPASVAGQKITLFLLVNDISLRNLIPEELQKGFGFFQSKPSSSFSPVAVTPDELEGSWDGHRIHLPIIIHCNETLFGKPNAGVDMHFDFPTLIAHAAHTRPLAAGTIIGSGTISNVDPSTGSACIAEVRMREKINLGLSKTPFLSFGDRVRIEMFDSKGHSIFGAIEQKIVPYQYTGDL